MCLGRSSPWPYCFPEFQTCQEQGESINGEAEESLVGNLSWLSGKPGFVS